MPRFLCLVLLFLTACTADLEPIVVTRVTETAVPGTTVPTAIATPTTIASATAVLTLTPTPQPTSETVSRTLAQPTATTTATAVPTPITTSGNTEGWLLYENSFYNYIFRYPAAANISVQGVTGFPTEELPTGMTSDTYLQQLEETFPDHICVGVYYQTGFVNVLAPWEAGGKYSAPCGGTGIGAYDLITATQELTVDGQLYTAQGYQARERNEAATWVAEFYSMQLADGTHVQYGSFQGAQGQYLIIEGTLRQIVESFHVGTISGMTTAVYSPITLTETTLFTHTAHSYTLQYPIGLHLLSNFGIESDISFATKPDAGSPLDLSPADFWVSVAQEDNPDGLSLSQWAEGLVKLGEARSVTVAGEPAFQISWNLREAGDSHNGFAIATYVAHEGQIYRFTGLAETADALAYYTPAYQLLLDTFRFLP